MIAAGTPGGDPIKQMVGGTMSDDDATAQIAQLQQQQALLTRALRAAVEGRWRGEDSVEAYLYALDPGLQGQVQPDPPRYDA